ncbi:MAG: CoA pyrophosphatase [Lachnospiraceae bacterium]|nr:CoA pyrophosphatase [Lachnospiraceae bacterium]
MDNSNLTPELIKQIFETHIPEPEGIYFKNSVLVPLIYADGELNILFTQRSLELKKQPGDICFPGGRQEKGEVMLETALRETHEELGIPQKNIRILGASNFIVTNFGAYITPFVGFIENMGLEDIKYSPNEVHKIIPVPLNFFMENPPAVHFVSLKLEVPEDFPFELIQGGRSYGWSKVPKIPELFYVYKDNIIWGITARIVNHVVKMLGGESYLDILR